MPVLTIFEAAVIADQENSFSPLFRRKLDGHCTTVERFPAGAVPTVLQIGKT